MNSAEHSIPDMQKHSDVQGRQNNLRLWPTPRDDEIEQAVENPDMEQQEKPLPAPTLARVFSRKSAASFDPGPAPGMLDMCFDALDVLLTISRRGRNSVDPGVLHPFDDLLYLWLLHVFRRVSNLLRK
jgi:hypothetical protein